MLGADDGQRHCLGGAVEGGDHHQPARPQQPGAVPEELSRIGHVLDHLHVEDHVERGAVLLDQGLDGRTQVADVQASFRGMGLGRADVALGGVDASDLEAQPRHGLAQQAPAAADIQQPQTLERSAGASVAAEAGQGLVTDEAQPDRVEAVQRRELALRIPPVGGEAGESLDFGDIDARALGVGHWRAPLAGRIAAPALRR